MASDNHVFACIFDDGEDNDDNEVARVPRRLLKLVIKYSIRVCLSCTLLSAVPQPGTLLQQPCVASIRVTFPGEWSEMP